VRGVFSTVCGQGIGKMPRDCNDEVILSDRKDHLAKIYFFGDTGFDSIVDQILSTFQFTK